MKTLALVSLMIAVIVSPVSAQETSHGKILKPAEEHLMRAVGALSPGTHIDTIAESVLPCIYELTIVSRLMYFDATGRYMIEGNVLDLKDRVNLSENRRATLQMASINKISEDQMVVFNNEEGNAQRHITVFTDSDCGFCQKLHSEIDIITDANIKVRYLLYPRAGMHSPSGKELESVWCAQDQQEAMTIAKTGGNVPHANCVNPIDDHVELAHEVELRGTPLIFLDSGKKIGGYQPAAQLIEQVLGSKPL